MPNHFILQSQLQKYTESNLYPLHMPGHKRQMSPAPGLPFDWDITEVEGADDLHQAQGILKEAMKRTSQLYGAAQTWYLVNGSTCGLLAGIRALAPMGSKIIVSRNCHKAVYHAIELGSLHPFWLIPPIEKDFGIYASISPESVEAALNACPEAACVILTSPTYEGVISDLASIALLCHDAGIPLLVDEAHGAHLGLDEAWPASAVSLGADLIIQSAHKTLPSLTQTAFLHLGKNSSVNPEEVERQLDIFETSSPSYPLLASLDGCTGILSSNRKQLFQEWKHNLDIFDKITAGLNNLKVLCHGKDSLLSHPDFFDFDPGKLAINTRHSSETGRSLAQKLRELFHFETEMACGFTTLAMTSFCDSAQAVESFAYALLSLDQQAGNAPASVPCFPMFLPPPGRAACTIAEAILQVSEPISLSQAYGRISAEYIWAYPPGVPLIAPGEQISASFIQAVFSLLASGTDLCHSHCKKPFCIQVLP